MAIAAKPLERSSRRSLLNSNFGRALDAHFPWLHGGRGVASVPHPACSLPTWGETDSSALGMRLEPARRALLDAVAPSRGARLLDVSAGDGALATEAAEAGWSVTAVEADARLAERGRRRCGDEDVPVRWLRDSPRDAKDGGFDAVVSCFAASHRVDQRRVARLMRHAAAPGGVAAMTAWKGLMASVMQISAPGRHGRSERWSRYETARSHFGDRPVLTVREHFMCWHFADGEAALAELSAPVRSATGRRRLREALPDLIELYGRRCETGLTLRADYVLVLTRG